MNFVGRGGWKLVDDVRAVHAVEKDEGEAGDRRMAAALELREQ